MQEDLTIYAADGPKVDELIGEYTRIVPTCGNWNPLAFNDDIRFCRWPGQSPDGKKHQKNMPEGTVAFPWDGASDARVALADDIIDEIVGIEKVAFFRALLQQHGVEANDLESAAQATKLLKWLMGSRQLEDLVTEVELHSQYTHAYGWSVLFVSWRRQVALKLVVQTVEDMLEIGAAAHEGQLPLGYAGFPQMVADPTMDEQSAIMLMNLMPALKVKRARRALKDLRENGRAEIPMPYLCRNEPQIRALKPWEEIVIPPECTDIQTANVVFVKEWLTEVQVRELVLTEEWDKAWVGEAVKHKGQYSQYTAAEVDWNGPQRIDLPWQFAMVNTKESLIEVLTAYRRLLDEEGVPGIYFTVFHPSFSKLPDSDKDAYALHKLLPYQHGKMPFVVRKREHRARAVASSRGVPEIVSTPQRAVKVQIDGLTDQTSLGVLPPILVPNLMGVDYKFAPAGQVPIDSPNRKPEFMQVPTRGTPVAFELWDRIERNADNRFGRLSETVPPPRSAVKQQGYVQGNLQSWTAAFRQEWQLAQQYMEASEIERIIGMPPAWLQDGHEIGKQYDLMLTFDVRELDPQFVEQKLKTIRETVVPLDVTGRIDRGRLVEMLLRSIDPSIAQELVMKPEAASQQLFRQVQNDVLLIFAGNEPEYVEMDPTAGTKLQFMSEIMKRNPKYQEAFEGDQRFRELILNYEKNLMQSVKQEENRMVGRLGVQSVGVG